MSLNNKTLDMMSVVQKLQELWTDDINTTLKSVLDEFGQGIEELKSHRELVREYIDIKASGRDTAQKFLDIYDAHETHDIRMEKLDTEFKNRAWYTNMQKWLLRWL